MQASDIFLDNERSANRYAAMCLRVAAAVTALMWGLNLLGFFIVDKQLMNVAMPGRHCAVSPAQRAGQNLAATAAHAQICDHGLLFAGHLPDEFGADHPTCLGLGVPLLLSCHYYSPRVTHFTLAGALICMFASVYIGLYFGVWDSNMMRSSDVLTGFAARADYILAARASGDDILVRVFNFYYIPRASDTGRGLPHWPDALQAHSRPFAPPGERQPRTRAHQHGAKRRQAHSGVHVAVHFPRLSRPPGV